MNVKRFFFLLLLLLAYRPFLAQVNSVNDLNITLEDLLSIKVDIASKTTEEIKNTPSTITVFTKEEIEQYGFDNLYELLNLIPGFQTERANEIGETTTIHLRGYSGNNPYILIQIDGIPINEISLGNTTIYSRFLSLQGIKQVEIIRGPGASLYGSNAFLGVVNMITDKSERNINIGVGTQYRTNLSSRYSGKINSEFTYHIGMQSYQDKGANYFFNDSTETSDPRRFYRIDAGFAYKGLNYKLIYSNEETEDFFNFGHINNDVNFNKTQNLFTKIDYTLKLNNKINITPSASFSRWNWDFVGLLVPEGTAGSSHNFIIGPYSQSSKYTISIDAEYAISNNDHLLAGFAFNYFGLDYSGAYTNHIDDARTTIAPIDSFYIGDVRAFREIKSFNDLVHFHHNDGGYIQYRRKFGENFLTYLGGRFDHYSVAKGAFSPRVGIIYHTPVNSTFKLLYGEAFRAPVHNELYSDDPTAKGNRNLLPDKVRTFEAIYSQRFKKGQTDITYFANSIFNVIEGVKISNSLNSYENKSDRIRYSGLEFSTQLSIVKKFLLRASATSILHTDFDNAFRNFGSLTFIYQYSGLNISLNTIVREKRKILNQQNTYLLLNGKVSYQINEKLKLYTKGTNLLNTEYVTYSPEFNLNNKGLVNRRIQLEAGINLKL